MLYLLLSFLTVNPLFPQPTDFLRANLILTAPPGTQFYIDKEDLPRMRVAIIQLAIQQEVMGESESYHWFNGRPQYSYDSEPDQPETDDLFYFNADLDSLRDLFEKSKSLPSLSECNKLPSYEYLESGYEFNRAYLGKLEKRKGMELDRENVILAAIKETEFLYRLYTEMRSASPKYHFYPMTRRQALKDVIDMIGEEDWEAGNIPPCVPLWRFVQEDYFYRR